MCKRKPLDREASSEMSGSTFRMRAVVSPSDEVSALSQVSHQVGGGAVSTASCFPWAGELLHSEGKPVVEYLWGSTLSLCATIGPSLLSAMAVWLPASSMFLTFGSSETSHRGPVFE